MLKWFFFYSVFTTEPESDLPFLPDKSKGQCLSNIAITYSDILNELNWVNPVAQTTVIHMYWKKSKMDIFYHYFLNLYRIPILVTAIHKKGDTSLPNNYCPISLTSKFCRMLESIVKKQDNVLLTYDCFLQWATWIL